MAAIRSERRRAAAKNIDRVKTPTDEQVRKAAALAIELHREALKELERY